MGKLIRLFVAIILPVIFAFFYLVILPKDATREIKFSEFVEAQSNHQSLLELGKKFDGYSQKMTDLKNYHDELSLFLKLPTGINPYRLYCKFDDPEAVTILENKKINLSLVFNIDINGSYLEVLNGSEEELVAAKSGNGTDQISFSFKILNEGDNKNLPQNISISFNDNSSIRIYPKLYLPKIYIIFVIFVFWYALLLLMAGYYRFVLYGEPYFKVNNPREIREQISMNSQNIKPTGCCEPFEPGPWQDKEITWKDKIFVKDHVAQFLHIPLNFGQKVVKNLGLIEKAGAKADHQLMLTDEKSLWGCDIYIDVVKDVPGAEMSKLSGTFMTRVFEGPYQKAGAWAKEMKSYAEGKGKKVKKIYFSYTTCPKCAKAYGKNYVVLFAQID